MRSKRSRHVFIFLFSWPSLGDLEKYSADEASVEASEAALADFLTRVARTTNADRIDIIAHSTGNRGQLRALNQATSRAALRAGIKFGEVILAAPDVDADLFAGNLLIQGDNLEALKALLPFYRGRAKCIFIDPPSNTRSAFEHYEDNLEHRGNGSP